MQNFQKPTIDEDVGDTEGKNVVPNNNSEDDVTPTQQPLQVITTPPEIPENIEVEEKKLTVPHTDDVCLTYCPLSFNFIAVV